MLSQLVRKRSEKLARKNEDLTRQLDTVKEERDREKARADSAEARVAGFGRHQGRPQFGHGALALVARSSDVSAQIHSPL